MHRQPPNRPSKEARVFYVLAWCVGGMVAWYLLGIAVFALWGLATVGEVGNLVGLSPALTAPLGFLAGLVIGLWRDRRFSRAAREGAP